MTTNEKTMKINGIDTHIVFNIKRERCFIIDTPHRGPVVTKRAAVAVRYTRMVHDALENQRLIILH